MVHILVSSLETPTRSGPRIHESIGSGGRESERTQYQKSQIDC
jgi:hypothetical protein